MVKKFIALVTLVFAMAVGTASQAQILDKIVLYFPNRIVDAMDTFSISLAFGPTARGEVWCTRPFAYGAGTGVLAKVAKGYNRQYGCGLESGSETNFMAITSETKYLSNCVGSLKNYELDYSGPPRTDERIYDFHEGARDYWSIGMTGGLAIAEVNGEFHPVEIVDFFAGFLFFDIKGDDFTFADLSN